MIPEYFCNLPSIETFFYYDFPQIHLTKHEATGNLFFTMTVEEKDDEDIWFFIPVSEGRLKCFREDQISYRDMVIKAESGYLFQVNFSYLELSKESVTIRPLESLTEDELPGEDTFFSK